MKTFTFGEKLLTATSLDEQGIDRLRNDAVKILDRNNIDRIKKQQNSNKTAWLKRRYGNRTMLQGFAKKRFRKISSGSGGAFIRLIGGRIDGMSLAAIHHQGARNNLPQRELLGIAESDTTAISNMIKKQLKRNKKINI